MQQAMRVTALGIKSKDALHFACAIMSHCDYFVTTDDGLLCKRDKIDGVSAINPVDFIRLLNEEVDNEDR